MPHHYTRTAADSRWSERLVHHVPAELKQQYRHNLNTSGAKLGQNAIKIQMTLPAGTIA